MNANVKRCSLEILPDGRAQSPQTNSIDNMTLPSKHIQIYYIFVCKILDFVNIATNDSDLL